MVETTDDKLLASFCSAGERRVLARLPEGERRRVFTELWTLKEAYSKLTGTGLATDFRSVAFQVETGRQVADRHTEHRLGDARLISWRAEAAGGLAHVSVAVDASDPMEDGGELVCCTARRPRDQRECIGPGASAPACGSASEELGHGVLCRRCNARHPNSDRERARAPARVLRGAGRGPTRPHRHRGPRQEDDLRRARSARQSDSTLAARAGHRARQPRRPVPEQVLQPVCVDAGNPQGWSGLRSRRHQVPRGAHPPHLRRRRCRHGRHRATPARDAGARLLHADARRRHSGGRDRADARQRHSPRGAGGLVDLLCHLHVGIDRTPQGRDDFAPQRGGVRQIAADGVSADAAGPRLPGLLGRIRCLRRGDLGGVRDRRHAGGGAGVGGALAARCCRVHHRQPGHVLLDGSELPRADRSRSSDRAPAGAGR